MMWVCIWELHSTIGKLVSWTKLGEKGVHQSSELDPGRGRERGRGASWSALLWEEAKGLF